MLLLRYIIPVYLLDFAPKEIKRSISEFIINECESFKGFNPESFIKVSTSII